MSEKNFTIKGTKEGESYRSIYLVFDGIRPASETLRFERTGDRAHFLVDVDADDLPIAMQVIAEFPSAKAGKQECHKDVNRIVEELFGFASQMVAYFRLAQEEERRNQIDAIIRRALLRSESLVEKELKKYECSCAR